MRKQHIYFHQQQVILKQFCFLGKHIIRSRHFIREQRSCFFQQC